jgi:hypothetical protein
VRDEGRQLRNRTSRLLPRTIGRSPPHQVRRWPLLRPFRAARSASKRFFGLACSTGVIFLTLDQTATQRRLIVDVPRRPERFAWRRVFDAACGFAIVPRSLSPRRSSFALHGDAWGLAIGGEFGSANASMPNDGSQFFHRDRHRQKKPQAYPIRKDRRSLPLLRSRAHLGAAGRLFGAKRPAERAGCAADALNIGCRARCARP